MQYNEARKGFEAAKAKAKQIFTFRSEKIENLLGKAERYLFSPSYHRDVKERSPAFGYGEEIADEGKKIEEIMTDLMDLQKTWNEAEEEKDDPEQAEDSLKWFEKELESFNKSHKQASGRDREVVARVMKRLRRSRF